MSALFSEFVHSLLLPVSTHPFFESAQTLIIINDSYQQVV